MKITAWILKVSAVSVLCGYLTIGSKASELISEASSKKYLSSDASIEMMARDVLDIEDVVFVRNHFNTAAKDRLVKIVYGQENHPRYDVLICNYGLIANENDVKLMNSYFDDNNRAYDGRRIGPFGRALMNMSNRKIPGSDQLLDKILHPTFWIGRTIDVNSLTYIHESDGNAESAIFMEVAFYKMRSSDKMKSEKIASALDEVPEIIRKKIASQTMIANYVCDVPRYSSLSESYVKNIQPQLDARTKVFFQKQQHYIDAKNKENEKRRAAQKITRERNNEYTRIYQNPKSRVVGEYNLETKKSIVKNAEELLERVIKPCLKQPADIQLHNALVLSMADNGIPLLAESSNIADVDTLFKKKPELSNDLSQTLKMVEDMVKYQCDLSNASVQSFSIRPLDHTSISEVLKTPKLHADIIIVAIPFDDSGDLKAKYPKFFKNVEGPFATLNAKGQPLMHFVYYRALNKWYWNPPGW